MDEARMTAALQPLLELIRETETGRDDPESYDVLYHGVPMSWRPTGRITEMTVGEVLSWQHGIRQKGAKSTAAGAYQFIYLTLKGLAIARPEILGKKFSPKMQDLLALGLIDPYRAEGFFLGSGLATFALHIARMWASFPVLAPTKGAKRDLVRGQSYYSGDGLNKALISPERTEAVLRECWNLYHPEPAVKEPAAPKPDFLSALLTALAKLFERKK